MENKTSFKDLSLFLIRLALGVIFIAHGLQKLLGWFGGSGIGEFSDMLAVLNIVPSLLWAWIVALSETLGGLFLVLGILPRLSAAFISVIMIVAILKVHFASGFLGGYEYQFLALMTNLSLVVSGAGKISMFNRL